MRYYANPCAPAVIAEMAAGVLGMIDTPLQRNATASAVVHAAGSSWCADNGCFSSRWREAHWWAWLVERSTYAATCAFAVAPDVVADAAATNALAATWLPRVRSLGYPAAYVAQNGAEVLGVPWGQLDVLFLGGTTAWKLGPHARALTADAVARGVPVHMGRVNSLKRYRYARAIGCTSVDGTFLTYGPDQLLPELQGWLREREQDALF